MNLVEIRDEIQNKRGEAGLLQEHLAKFVGLSRVTINQLENGTLRDLGYTKLKANVLAALHDFVLFNLETKGGVVDRVMRIG